MIMSVCFIKTKPFVNIDWNMMITEPEQNRNYGIKINKTECQSMYTNHCTHV
jgi:hypothetical protein